RAVTVRDLRTTFCEWPRSPRARPRKMTNDLNRTERNISKATKLACPTEREAAGYRLPRNVGRSVERENFSVLVIGHAGEVVSRVDLSCPAKKELLERP